jgi:hypothetical protein
MEKFRALYALTPLPLMKRDPGEAARWQQVYGQNFENVVDAWLATLPRKRNRNDKACSDIKHF